MNAPDQRETAWLNCNEGLVLSFVAQDRTLMPPDSPAPMPAPTPTKSRQRTMPLIALLVSLAATAILYGWSVRTEITQRDADIDRLATRFSRDLSGRVQSYIDTLPGLRVFAVLSHGATDLEFEQYLEAISLQKRFPGLALTFSAEYLRHDELPRFIRETRTDRSIDPAGHPDFVVRPGGQRPSYMVIRHNYPFVATAFGYDLYDPGQRYRVQVDAAARSGSYVATPPILLADARDQAHRPELTSIVTRLAVYRGGRTPETQAERLAALQGVVGVAFRTAELVDSVLSAEMNRMLSLQIIDVQARQQGMQALIYDSRWGNPGDGDRRSDSAEKVILLGIADREWEVRAWDPVSPLRLWLAPTPLLILACGLVLSAALTLLLRTLVRARRMAEHLVDARTADLRAQQRDLEETQRIASIGSWMLDIANDQLSWSRESSLIFGVPETVRSGSLQNFLAIVHPADRELVHAAVALAIKQRSALDIEHRVQRADSSEVYVQSRGEMLTDAAGNAAFIRGSVQDMTERRQAEAALRAKALAEQANQAKSQFVARMSHELRTPLNAVLGFAQVLQFDTAEPVTAAQRQSLQHIQHAGEHLLRLIEDLLDVSRIEAGTLHMSLRPIDPLALMRDAVRDVALQAEAAQITLVIKPVAATETTGATAPLRILADRTRLHQVLVNLLSNAIKYNRPKGSVSLRIEPAGDGELDLAVDDTGIGLDAEQLQNLFQPFNRLGREHSDVQGTGIGLVISRSLLELMGGSLRVSSTAGQGSCFTARLRRAEQSTGPQVPAQHADSLPASRADLAGRVLYIDDDEANRLLMQAIFAPRPGVELRLATSGVEGLALAEEWRPDLMLIDLMMPGMSGLEVLQALRGDAALHATPCLAVSATALPDDIREALQAGFRGFITKPLNIAALLAEIDGRLKGRQTLS